MLWIPASWKLEGSEELNHDRLCMCGTARWTELASATAMQLHPLPPNQVGRSQRGLWRRAEEEWGLSSATLADTHTPHLLYFRAWSLPCSHFAAQQTEKLNTNKWFPPPPFFLIWMRAVLILLPCQWLAGMKAERLCWRDLQPLNQQGQSTINTPEESTTTLHLPLKL